MSEHKFEKYKYLDYLDDRILLIRMHAHDSSYFSKRLNIHDETIYNIDNIDNIDKTDTNDDIDNIDNIDKTDTNDDIDNIDKTDTNDDIFYKRFSTIVGCICLTLIAIALYFHY